MSVYYKLALVFSAALIACAQFAGAQEDKAKDDKASFDPKSAKDGASACRRHMISFSLSINWCHRARSTGGKLSAKSRSTSIPISSRTRTPSFRWCCVRIADGVMAVKARDVELLNKAASDIETLAKRMGVPDSDLNRARAVRAAANKKEWLNVFMELGFFQQDIMKKLEDKESSARTTLLITAGWLQGARYTTALIEDHYTAATSNLLREPKLIEALSAKMDGLPAASKSNAAVTKIREALPQIQKIINIPLDGSVPKESVAELNRLSTDAVKAAVATK